MESLYKFCTIGLLFSSKKLCGFSIYLRHRLISIQEQDAVLFGSTVRECLTFGTDNIDQGGGQYHIGVIN